MQASVSDYGKWRLKDLKEEAALRKLSTKGARSDLIERLEEDQKIQASSKEGKNEKCDLCTEVTEDLIRMEKIKKRRDKYTTIPLTSVGEMIEKFDGEKFSIWKAQIENVQKVYEVTDEEMKLLVVSKLKGKPLEWFHSKPSNIEVDLNTLLADLGKVFNIRINRVQRQKKFEERKWKPNEDFNTYARDKLTLGNSLDIPEEDIVEYIIEGIMDPIIQNQARMQQFVCMEKLLSAMQNVEQHRNIQRQARAAGDEGASQSKKCYNCGGDKHIAAQCQKPKIPRGACFGCGSSQHQRKNCPNRNTTRKPQAAEHVNTLHEIRVSSCFMSIDILCEDKDSCIWKPYMVLIDTGSSVCLIKEEIVKNNKLELVSNKTKFFGLNKVELVPIGRTDVYVKIDKRIIKVSFLVVNNNVMTTDVIIGRDLFATKGLSLVVDSFKKTFENEIFDICVNEVKTNNYLVGNSYKVRDVDTLIDTYSNNMTSTDKPEIDYEMKIKLSKEDYFSCTPRRLAFTERQKLLNIIDDLLVRNIIRPSSSPYCSPVVLVKKKNKDEYRLCIDFRALNKVTVRENYPLPLIEDLIDKLEGKSWFSVIDLKSGFHQIRMEPESCKYTSFITPFGQYEYTKMPFGLKNAPCVFQRYVEMVFKDMIREGTVVIYIDDILIATKSVDEHLEILNRVLHLLAKNLLEINSSKCKFLCKNIEFLGYDVSEAGIKPNLSNLKTIKDFPVPKNIRDIQRFLGLCSYFRKFVNGFTIIAKPLQDLVKKNVPFKFGSVELEAFELLKTKLLEEPLLAIYSPTDVTELHCDGSSLGYGAILLQKKSDGKYHPIFYFSKRATLAESRYHSYELETLAIVYALRRFRVYLLGRPFKIITDCNALALTLSKQIINPRISRWALEMQNFDYFIEHREGKRMQHVDALSRAYPILVLEEGSFEQMLAICQSQDPSLEELRKQLEISEHPLYELRDGLIYRKIDKKRIRFYLPEEMVVHVLKISHDSVGHTGVDKTYEIIGRSYWFPKMKEKIRNYIQCCPKCVTFSPKSGRAEGFMFPIPKGDKPFDTIHVDHYGPLEITKARKKYILVIVDGFTKFISLYATRTTKSEEAIQCLKKYFTRFSRPIRLISDRGTAFTSAQFEQFMQQEGIHHILVASGCPRANGQVERINRVIGPMIAKLISPSKPWDHVLTDVEFAINNTVCRSTSYTPSMLLYGVNQRGERHDKVAEYLQNFILTEEEEESIDSIRDKAANNMTKSQSYNAVRFNEKRKEGKKYQEGDLILVTNVDTTPGISKKLIPRYKGPYVIDKVLNNDRYVLKDVEGFPVTQKPMKGVYDVSRIKPWLYQPNKNDKTDLTLDKTNMQAESTL